MNVSELYELTHWIDNEIVNKQIIEKYNALLAILKQNAQPNQQMKPFETQKENLMEALNSVALDQITKDQLKFLDGLGIFQAVGKEGITAIEDLLYKNVIDVATSAKKIHNIIKRIGDGINKSNQIETGLDGCIFEEEYETDNEILMRVSFTGNAAMSNVVDFKSWGNIWFEIGRGIAMANGSSPEEVKIVGATKGSIVIELAVVYAIAKTACRIMLETLKVAERVLEIRRKAEEIRELKLSNDKSEKELEKEADKEKEKGIDNISKVIIKELKIKKNSEGDKVNALNKSIKNLVEFIGNGGDVDFVIPEEEPAEEGQEGAEEKPSNPQMQELRDAFKEIRQLESKMKLLEHKKDSLD